MHIELLLLWFIAFCDGHVSESGIVHMGEESIWMAAMSAVFCPSDTQIGCMDIKRYTTFANATKGFVASKAFLVFSHGLCATLIPPLTECPQGFVAFGITQNCAHCTSAGYGWCEDAYLFDNNTQSTLAPTCIDPNRVSLCPFTSTPPVLDIEQCGSPLRFGLIDGFCYICDKMRS